MKVGLDYVTMADLPTDEQLFGHFYPGVIAAARAMGLRDPEHAAADAITSVVVVSRYQDRWNPSGTGKLEHYLYTMVLNRLRDVGKRQRRRLANELVGVSYGQTNNTDGDPSDGELVPDPQAHQGFESAELRASIPAMREILATTDAGWDDEVKVSLSDLFDAITERTLRSESTSCRELGRQFGVSHSTIRLAQRRLYEVLQGATCDA